ncbi:MAG: acetyl-CoA carboxylase biotin carboxyl carrier protein [Candidatus Omnitrophica bacterium]|nr:acetyl-CoA carboxylase biotin carboxyl carrier protein [Candidatus Omnitrophota bacterium]
MEIKEIKELIALMETHNLVEIEIEKEGKKIRLRKEPSVTGKQEVPREILPRVSSGESTATAPQSAVTSGQSHTVQIKSPMIGTFYRAPHPEAPPFVEIGEVVEPGKVLCIIEAMKLMNEIKAEIKGKIIEVLVNNGDPVEFGQPLFLLEPI